MCKKCNHEEHEVIVFSSLILLRPTIINSWKNSLGKIPLLVMYKVFSLVKSSILLMATYNLMAVQLFTVL